MEKPDETQLVLYMVGHGQPEPNLSFVFNEEEYLDPNGVNSILSIDPNWCGTGSDGITAISILDFCHSGGFINKIKGENRICISSCGENQGALFPDPTTTKICFSNMFFNNIRKGETIADAFRGILNDFELSDYPLKPRLDANGDGYPNNPGDYRTADIPLGLDTIGGGDWAGIQEISHTIQYIDDPNDITLWVKVARLQNRIEVSGFITPPYPSNNPIYCKLENLGEGFYGLKADDKKIFLSGGNYIVTLYAQDFGHYAQSQVSDLMFPYISQPKKVLIIHEGEDSYENDDESGSASRIFPDGRAQNHTLHNFQDQDWVFFFGHKDGVYTIEACDILGRELPITLSLYGSNDFETPVIQGENHIRKTLSQDDYYYLRVEHGEGNLTERFAYNLSIRRDPWGSGSAAVYGRIINRQDEGVNDVRVLFSFTGPDTPVRVARSASIKDIQEISEIAVDPKLYDGWYFIPVIPLGKDYDIWIPSVSSDEPIRESIDISIPLYEYRMEDIVLDTDMTIDPNSVGGGNPDFVANFYAVYGYWQAEKDFYDPDYSSDYDQDNVSNLEEFLYGRDPTSKDVKCLIELYPGLNLYPFYYNNPDSCSTKLEARYFFKTRLEEGDSLWMYEDPNQQWEWITMENGELFFSNPFFEMKNGNGYSIYKHQHQLLPKLIFIDENSLISPLTPGLNFRAGQSIVEVYQIQGTPSSFKLLQEPEPEEIQNINRYDNKKGNWESSYQFFNQPAGRDFSILPNEAYMIMTK